MIALVKPLVERTRPGYGQRFATSLTVVDAEDGSVLPPVVSSGPTTHGGDYAVEYSFSGSVARVSWRYPGDPLTIRISSKGYEVAEVELRPDSPAAMTVPLKRRVHETK